MKVNRNKQFTFGKIVLVLLILLFQTTVILACPVCEKNQPKLLKGIAHGTGPQSNLDYIIVWTAVILVLFTLFYTVKWLIWPGEKAANHIKRTVIN